MKDNIVRLIQDDIKISRLIDTLERLNIQAYHYHLGNSKVIFSLMNIPEIEPNLEIYYQLIERAEDLAEYNTPEKMEALADEVFRQLTVL
jgi:hypothetical protein